MKLFKYLQIKKGISRRDFLDMLKEKVIKINGQLVEDFDFQVQDGNILEIKLPNGEVYKEKINIINSKFRPVVVLFNKPKGYVVSKQDKHNKTIFDILPASWKRDFYYIGRLDKSSHGLLLLTNVPELVDKLSNPKKVFKIYQVRIDKPFSTNAIKSVKKGLRIDEQGNKLGGPDENADFLFFYDVKYNKLNNKHYLRIVLTEGKKRHIRRLLKALGYKVLDLKREKFGPYSLGTIKPGKWKIERVKRFFK